MSRIKRWLDHKRVVWTEPALPKYIKINPNSPPGAADGLQPGDMSMLKVAEEFLEEPEEGLALSGPRTYQPELTQGQAAVICRRAVRDISCGGSPRYAQERTRSFQWRDTAAPR